MCPLADLSFRRGFAVGKSLEFSIPGNMNSRTSVKSMKILLYQFTFCFIIYFIFLLKLVHCLLNKFVLK